MKVLNEVRREEDMYFCGAFWIVADSVDSIMKGNFKIVGKKYLCDYSGKIVDNTSKSSKSHLRLWRDEFKQQLGNDKGYTYYPRGRVSIYNGKAYIHINSLTNTPRVIDSIIDYYSLQKLKNNIEVECNDETQGSHYDFELQ